MSSVWNKKEIFIIIYICCTYKQSIIHEKLSFDGNKKQGLQLNWIAECRFKTVGLKQQKLKI